MYCLNCGKALNSDELFCAECGTRVQNTPDYGQSSAAPLVQNEPVTQNISAYQPVQNMNYAVAEPKVKKQRIPRKKAAVGITVVLSIIYGILAFAFITYGVVGLIAGSTLRNNGFSEKVSHYNPSDMPVYDIVTKTDIVQSLSKLELRTSRIDPEMSLAELSAYAFGATGIDCEAVENILADENCDIMPFIGRVVKAYEDYLVTGESSSPVTPKNVMSTIKKSRNVILKHGSFDVKPYYDYTNRVLSENSKEFKKLNPDRIFGDVKDFTNVILMPILSIAAIVLAAGFIFLIWVVTARTGAMMTTGGIVSLVLGASLILIKIFAGSIISIFLNVENKLLGYIVDLLSPLTDKFLIFGIILMAAGAALVVVKALVGKAQKKKSVNNAAMSV